jgi:glycerophosphoryl diester phosphodiesterase
MRRNPSRRLLLAFIAAMSAAELPAADATSPALALLKLQRPLVIAHRGYSSFAPENSLPSFKLALAAGADLVELDYHHSKDGVPIVIHDAELDRTTDATNKLGQAHIKVGALDAAEIQKFEAGSWFDRSFAGTRILTLGEALDFIQKSGVTLIERKAGPPGKLAEILKERDLVNRLVVQSFDWEFLQQFHALLPDQVIGVLGPPSRLPDGTKPPKEQKDLTPNWLEQAIKLGANIIVWSKELSPESIKNAHARGLKVWIYTIDDPQLATAFLDLGADGIITNNTSAIWRALALRTGR